MKEAKKRVKDTKKCVKEEINKEVDGERNFLKCEEPLVGEERRKRSRNFKKKIQWKERIHKVGREEKKKAKSEEIRPQKWLVRTCN